MGHMPTAAWFCSTCALGGAYAAARCNICPMYRHRKVYACATCVSLCAFHIKSAQTFKSPTSQQGTVDRCFRAQTTHSIVPSTPAAAELASCARSNSPRSRRDLRHDLLRIRPHIYRPSHWSPSSATHAHPQTSLRKAPCKKDAFIRKRKPFTPDKRMTRRVYDLGLLIIKNENNPLTLFAAWSQNAFASRFVESARKCLA